MYYTTYTGMHTPVLMDGEKVKPLILVFFGAKHCYLVVDKHPVQALIWDRAYKHTQTHTEFRQILQFLSLLDPIITFLLALTKTI